jgi:hypothetical protein
MDLIPISKLIALGLVSHGSLSRSTDKMYPSTDRYLAYGTVVLWVSIFQVSQVVSSNAHTAQTYDSSVDISLKATHLKLRTYRVTI